MSKSKVSMDFTGSSIHTVIGNVEGDISLSYPERSSEIKQSIEEIYLLLSSRKVEQPPASMSEEHVEIEVRQVIAESPQKWSRWSNALQVIFEGGVEAAKATVPFSGIPIEMLRKLYEVWRTSI